MKSSAAGRAAAAIIASALLATACTAGGDESRIQSGTVVTTAESSTTADTVSTPSTASTAPIGPTDPSAPAVASAEAESFKVVAPTIDELGADVQRLIDAIAPPRIDQLADGACGSVNAGMSDSELGLQGLAGYRGLTDDEQALISIDDWVVFYGALIGFFCPDSLPDIDRSAARPPGETDVEQFRVIVTDVDGVSGETESFVDGLSDDRLDELQAEACDRTTPDMNTEQFGLLIVSGYDTELTEAESSTITLSGFSELFGALVGWFCPNNLPR